ncbi:MAG TPA: SGNH/GDSL hydrolase family protein [Mucilaginibacter sp.]|jgi:lysophospholipase L1-like esterase
MIKNITIAVILISAGYLSCKKDDPVLNTQNIANKKSIIAKSKSGLFIKIACEGTSLTYGEDIKGSDTASSRIGFPGAITRAEYQYPSSMLQALNNHKVFLSVRGFPGDRTTEAIERWKDSTSADICIIEYGTNDAYNYAAYASGIVPADTYKKQLELLVQRRIDQGAWVILCIPPYLENDDKQINPYRSAARSVAHELSLDVFDIEASIKQLRSPYSDEVHFNSNGYRKWGFDIATLIYPIDR